MLHNIISKAKSRDALIFVHINYENNFDQRNRVDKNHTNLFRGYSTLVGYKKRIKKHHPDVRRLFPFGTAVYGVCLIMHQTNNAELAFMESEILCKHPQSLLVCRAIIILYQTGDMDKVREEVKEDEVLLELLSNPRETNVLFLPLWVRHYFASCIYGYNKWPSICFENQPMLLEIYRITFDHFHHSPS